MILTTSLRKKGRTSPHWAGLRVAHAPLRGSLLPQCSPIANRGGEQALAHMRWKEQLLAGAGRTATPGAWQCNKCANLTSLPALCPKPEREGGPPWPMSATASPILHLCMGLGPHSLGRTGEIQLEPV